MSSLAPAPDLAIDPDALGQQIEQLGRIGEQPGGGIIRPVYSPAWVEARRQLASWMQAAGLEVREDAVGNLFGRLEGPEQRTLLTGSHIDTVKLGGRYDGALGVLAGLAALRVLHERAGRPNRSLEVVALCEEENSRFSANFWGTRGMLGLIERAELDTLRDEDGVTIGEAMRAVGLPAERFREAVRDDLDLFLELHIEQGRILFDSGVQLGIVQTITGIVHDLVVVEGRTDHAGTTPMDLRRDAFQGAAEMAREATRLVEAEGAPAVVTTGRWSVQPGAWNIVPGRVEFTLDLRHPDEPTKQRLAAAVRERCRSIAAQRGLTVSIETHQDVLPMDMDARLAGALLRAAEARGASHRPMVSGAGHDSQVMARRVPTAMLFVPSVEGRSHSAAEYTSPDDAARGATVLATALHRLAY